MRERLIQARCIKTASGQPERNLDGNRLLPIIPLVGKAAEECVEPAWPIYTQEDLSRLEGQIESRVELVLDKLTDQYFEDSWWRIPAKWIIGRKKSDMVDSVRKRIQGDLKKMQLMR